MRIFRFTLFYKCLLLTALFSSDLAFGADAKDSSCAPKLTSIYKVHLSKLRPTQMEFGGALVQARAQELLIEAAQAGLRPLDYVALKRDKVVPAVISPRGEFFVTDSHHGIATIYKMLGKRADLKVRLAIQRDYRAPKEDGSHWTYEEFILTLQSPQSEGGMGKGQFSKEVKGKSPEARFAYLPARFDKLKDNPIRSLVGSAFKILGIAPELFEDYIEFNVADLIPTQQIGDTAFSPFNVQKTANIILESKEIMSYLRSHFRDAGTRQDATRQIDAALSSRLRSF